MVWRAVLQVRVVVVGSLVRAGATKTRSVGTGIRLSYVVPVTFVPSLGRLIGIQCLLF